MTGIEHPIAEERSERIFITLQHASFEPSRRVALERCLERLPKDDPDCFVCVIADPHRSGAWRPARKGIEAGVASGAPWIVVMNDDAMPCEDFARVLRRVLVSHDPSLPLCLYPWHRAFSETRPHPLVTRARELAETGGTFTTVDGLVGVGYVLSRQAAISFLSWHDEAMTRPLMSSDTPVCYWAMATGRLLVSTVPALVDHQCPDESLRGHADDEGRRPSVLPWEGERALAVDWSRPPVHLGRVRQATHWHALYYSRPSTWDLESLFLVERQGEPVSSTPLTMIASPSYGGIEPPHMASRERLVVESRARGLDLLLGSTTSDDSLITRARNAWAHNLLASPATGMLFWDCDLEALDPAGYLAAMLASGRDVVGGIYPARRPGGAMIAWRAAGPEGRPLVRVESDGCAELAAIGTGFLYVSRRAIVRLCQAHPDLLYEQDCGALAGRPAWALFDTHLEGDSVPRRYLSEDYRFCQLWRALGERVYGYLPARFRHWGKAGYDAAAEDAWRDDIVGPESEAAVFSPA